MLKFKVTIVLACVPSVMFFANCSYSSKQDNVHVQKENPVPGKVPTSAATGEPTETTSTRLQEPVTDQYTYIAGIHSKPDTDFINADFVQFLTGNAAIRAAQKNGDADTFQTEDGKTQIAVPNDYYILNENKKIRQLALARNCVFDLRLSRDRIPPITVNSLESLEKIYQEALFIITIKNENLVVKVKEVFLP